MCLLMKAFRVKRARNAWTYAADAAPSMCMQDLAEQLKETADVVLPVLAPTSNEQGCEPVLAALEAAGVPCAAAPADALRLSDRSRYIVSLTHSCQQRRVPACITSPQARKRSA